MGVDFEAVLVMGWELNESNVRKLVALMDPEVDTGNEAQLCYAMCRADDMDLNGWHIVCGGNDYSSHSTTYYLSMCSGGDTVHLDSLMRTSPEFIAAGRDIATRIGIDPQEPAMVHAVGYIW